MQIPHGCVSQVSWVAIAIVVGMCIISGRREVQWWILVTLFLGWEKREEPGKGNVHVRYDG